MWLPDASLYSYKAREYSAALGRFMQTDPIGQSGGPNIYAYVGGDPVNQTDPSGLGDNQLPRGTDDDCEHIECVFVTRQPANQDPSLSFSNEMALWWYANDVTQEFQLTHEQVGGDEEHCPSSINWRVTPASPSGGVVIQHISGTITNAAGVVIHSWQGWEGGGANFWTVRPGGSITVQHRMGGLPDDTFMGANVPQGGTMTVHAEAWFFAGQTTPPDFRSNNPLTPFSRDLPSSPNNPGLTPSSNADVRDVTCHVRR